MFNKILKRASICLLLGSLAACGAAERVTNIGRAPELTPIKNIKAPLAERSISLPMPSTTIKRPRANSLWRVGARSFFKDQRASKIGDILTVNINISDSAQIGNTTARARTTAENAGLTNAFGLEEALRNVLFGNAPTAAQITAAALAGASAAEIAAGTETAGRTAAR
ncbi:MAG: flagellar basal body L-ring protein FlgH, partial [Kordiimonadaceae bacterium]|nr:flagellar basal body L-ring protein FlgH [Kordiimonadaceae bacterium]